MIGYATACLSGPTVPLVGPRAHPESNLFYERWGLTVQPVVPRLQYYMP